MMGSAELVIRIKGSERYFHGCCDDCNKPVFGEYNDGMKIYRDSKKWTAERRARQAIEVIGMNGCIITSLSEAFRCYALTRRKPQSVRG